MGVIRFVRQFFSHTERHDFQVKGVGRQVSIRFPEDLPRRWQSIFTAMLHDICEHDDVAGFTDELTFIFLDATGVEEHGLENTYTGFKNSEAAAGKCRVYINTAKMTETWQDKRKFNNKVLETLSNIQAVMEEVRQKYAAHTRKLREKLDEQLRDVDENEAVKEARTWLQTFLQSLVLEGVPAVAPIEPHGKLGKWVHFASGTYREWYDDAYRTAKELDSILHGFIHGANPWPAVKQVMLEAREPLGRHIVYTVFDQEDLDLDTFFDMGWLQVLKRYEESVEEKGDVPLITVESGDGILDYKHLLTELQHMIE